MTEHNNSRTILVGDDELEVRRYLETAVRTLGYSVQTARDGDEVLSFLEAPHADFSAVLLDMQMPNRDGLDTLREIHAVYSGLPVIFVSGQSSAREAVAAMKGGAADFLCKPVEREELGRVLNRVLHSADYGRQAANVPASTDAFVSIDPKVKEMQARVGQVGRSGLPVLIQGETGCGKEVLARELHSRSSRAGKPFLKLNCAALPSELVESELFGYERGAFTGAHQRKAGMFELADGGTILLDEIGDMDIRLQAKLLQVLQDQEFRRVGGKEIIKVDVRIIAATHRDLERAINEGAFREDLYYRLNVIILRVPPLRDRVADIVPLGEFLLRKHAVQGSAVPAIGPELRHAMLSCKWPGNVRELENCMRNLAIFDDPDGLARDIQSRTQRKLQRNATALPDANPMGGKAEGVSVLEQVTKVGIRAEADAILAALDSTRWNRKQAASVLKVDYKSLLYKMKKLGINSGPVSLSEREAQRSHVARTANGD
jgi:two-component system response regulator AtoC